MENNTHMYTFFKKLKYGFYKRNIMHYTSKAQNTTKINIFFIIIEGNRMENTKQYKKQKIEGEKMIAERDPSPF